MSEARAAETCGAALREIRAGLALEFAALGARLEAAFSADPVEPAWPAAADPASRFSALADLFGLDSAGREILTLAAGAELAPDIAAIVRRVRGEDCPDIALAIALRPEDGWDALAPDAPLRRWRLVALSGSGVFLRRRLTIDERVLQFLMGTQAIDDRLEGLVSAQLPQVPLEERERAVVQRLVACWTSEGAAPVALLAGRDHAAKRGIAAAAAADAGLRLLSIDAADLPADWVQRSALATFLDRELVLSHGALLIECRDNAGAVAAARLSDALARPVAIAAPDPVAPERRPRVRLDLSSPERAERQALWRTALGPRAETLGPGLDRLAEQFTLDRSDVAAAVGATVNGAALPPESLLGSLWRAARAQARRNLDTLAERIESGARWDDLVLPAEQMSQLRELAAHAREAWRVNEDWGWRAKGARGLGAAALFAGPSGTGKTLAAEVIAGELALDLYRVDLSQTVSKYIGETEKNLSRIFTAAEDGGAVLLFDEADALFGKRSEVRDSHDRYANVEVSYLLQRMESYRGLAILTTNQKSALDASFLRRLRHIVVFPFPDAAARAEIWARIFPGATPTEGLDPLRLARMNLAGGSIRSIALNACYLAARDGGPVRIDHLRTAARREYAKLEKPFTATEQGATT